MSEPKEGGQNASDCTEERELFPVRIRTADEGDVPFIFKSWLLSYQGQNKHIPAAVIHEYEPAKIQRMLNENVTIMLVGDTDASAGDIYGFCCAQRVAGTLVVYFIYVKASFRKWGFAKAMLNAFDYKRGEVIFHPYNFYLKRDLRQRGYNMMFVPYLKDLTKDEWETFYENNRASIE